jgi:hypothetical protein
VRTYATDNVQEEEVSNAPRNFVYSVCEAKPLFIDCFLSHMCSERDVNSAAQRVHLINIVMQYFIAPVFVCMCCDEINQEWNFDVNSVVFVAAVF